MNGWWERRRNELKSAQSVGSRGGLLTGPAAETLESNSSHILESMEAATSASPASTPKIINPAAPSPTAFLKGADSPRPKSQIDSSGNGESFSWTISFATLASPPPHGSVPTNQPQTNSLAVEQAPNLHTSRGAVGTLIVLLFALGIFFIAGYWACNISSRWKGLRWTRYPESKWTPLSLSHVESERGREQTESLNNTGIDHSAISPTFNTRRDKGNPLQLYLNYRRGRATGSLEEIDEELDSAEQTARSSIETAKPTITPGLGPARYRLKACNGGSSDSLHVKSIFNTTTNSNLAGFKKGYYIPHNTTASSGRNTRKASDLARDLERSSAEGAGYEEFGINQHRRDDIHRSTGASYLLTRLKESITRCTKLSNMRSLGRHAQRDERGTKGSGGVEGEEFESKTGAAAADGDASEMRHLVLSSFKHAPTRDIPVERELSLAEIPLPESPALAWNMSPNDLALINNAQQPRPAHHPHADPSGQIHPVGEMSTPSRPPRHPEWTLSSRALSPCSSSPANWPETPTRKPKTSTPNLTDTRTYFATSRLHF
ncbi:hypothetical protein VP01_1953g1 [Puccinia sorghi]|uniref:Uncharacterized protein n=1 Tax=Puccinia sorghi TaxID=27349 RepID=A0A0L6VDX3_9BASI|nr:hypothetical protein VP01_1953g1 [Puccinia sorghi]